ncbi:MAG: ACP S-malonyltransferase [Gemmatimonadaceae bacterium]
MDIVLLFPGQGSQRPGMGRDLAEEYPASRRIFDAIDGALGFPLSAVCWGADSDALTLTHNAQPALLAHGLAAWAATRDMLQGRVRAAAGHSLGEFTAYAAAGTLSVEDAAGLVRRRGQLMLEEGARRPGAMAAVVGKISSRIEDLCRTASGANDVVVPANYNSDDQVVVSGTAGAVARLGELAKAAGAKRIVPLKVSGAFHSPLMAGASAPLDAALERCEWRDPAFPVYSNVNERPNTSGPAARALLLLQLTAPVLWAGEIALMAATFPGALFVEMGPGNVLSGLVKRVAPGVATATCGSAADVERIRMQVAA